MNAMLGYRRYCAVFPEDRMEVDAKLVLEMDKAITKYVHSKFFGGKEAYQVLCSICELGQASFKLKSKIVELKECVEVRQASHQGIYRVASILVNISSRIFCLAPRKDYEYLIRSRIELDHNVVLFFRKVQENREKAFEFMSLVEKESFSLDQLFAFSKLLIQCNVERMQGPDLVILAEEAKMITLDSHLSKEMFCNPKESEVKSLIIEENELVIMTCILKLFRLPEVQRFELAIMLLEEKPSGLIANIELFDLLGEHCFYLACKIIESEDTDVFVLMELSTCISEFKLTIDQLFLVFNKLVERKTPGLACDVEKFKLTKEQLQKFGHQFVESEPVGLISGIQKFDLTQDERFEIGKRLIKDHLHHVLDFLDGFALEEVQRFELAKIIAEKMPLKFFICWGEFGIANKEMNVQLLAAVIVHNPLIASNWYQSSSPLIFNMPAEMFLFLYPEEEPKEKGFLSESFFFNELIKGIKGQEKKEERSLLLKWLGYTELCRKFYGVSELGVQGALLLEEILDLRQMPLRYKLSKRLFHILSEPHLKTCLESKAVIEAFPKKSTSLLRLLLVYLLSEPLESIDLKEVVTALNFECYKDVSLRKIVISSFLCLLDAPDLTPQDRIKIVKIIFPEEAIKGSRSRKKVLKNQTQEMKILSRKIDEGSRGKAKRLQNELLKSVDEFKVERKALSVSINKSLQLVEALINMNYTEKLKEIETLEDLEKAVQEMFTEVTGIGVVEDLAEKYVRTLASFRSPESIFIYVGKLKQLHPLEDRIAVLYALKGYVEAVLNGTLATVRYQDGFSGDHLHTVFSGREELKALWMQGEKCAFNDFLLPQEETFSTAQWDVRTFLQEKICLDAHISSEKIAYLDRCLKNPSEIEREMALLENAMETEESITTLNELHLQKGVILLLEGNKTAEEKVAIFQAHVNELVETSFPCEEQFKRDLYDLKAALLIEKKEKTSSFEGWSVVDTDSAEDMLLCGTEIYGSCQNINGTPERNKCLLAYLLDGKNRLIAVKNGRGEIVARGILRILWDEKARVPVLFQERTYVRPGLDFRVEITLNRMFCRRSQILNIPLVTSGNSDQGPPYPNSICSLGGRAPFEYVDAERKGVTNGQFAINSSIFVRS